MANKMLIDSTHPEETRVVVVRGSRVEEFDFESASRKPLRGNIYLAKVTRVEPSLQAAFVDYGGNRHGFLAFNEIHPDYYQIPYADRQALLEQDAREDEEDDAADERGSQERDRRERSSATAATEAPTVSADAPPADEAAATGDGEPAAAEAGEAGADAGEVPPAPEGAVIESVEHDGPDAVESVGAEDAMEEVPERRPQRNRRSYKIQEVIKRRQVLLVQVVKEERGNKGAALTTYLSLAGRYAVLMPNTARGGGISRKITSAADRKRLKQIATDLEVPEGMGVILRTAGANRTKVEVKRDFEYLLRQWESVRDLTLQSSAPALVYEEGNLVKRSIRDLYNRDIDEILVAGEDGYREAKDFMRMLMPSHAKNVKPYREPSPLFTRFGVEAQLDAMFSPQVTLKSGGYIVIHQTEALVSIDVNSGRSTREHNIEDTALQTNLEASDEVARQLRLRDLAGLIVIDYIDMEEKRNNRAVEKRLKDALKSDRARIQVGRISHFGLMEMSRQRIRQGVVESSTQMCPHCYGTGLVRSTDSVALHVLRTIEEQLLKSSSHNLTVRTRTAVALYILNQKRKHLADIELRFQVTITLAADDSIGNQMHAIERGELAVKSEIAYVAPVIGPYEEIDVEDDVVEPEVEEEQEAVGEDEDRAETAEPAAGENGRRRRRRRRRRRGEGGGDAEAGGRDASAEAGEETDADGASDDVSEPVATAPAEADGAETVAEADKDGEDKDDDEPRRRRRRGRRGGRRRQEGGELFGEDGEPTAEALPFDAPSEPAAVEASETVTEPESAPAAPVAEVEAPAAEAPAAEVPAAEAPAAEAPAAEPVVAESVEAAAPAAESVVAEATPAPEEPVATAVVESAAPEPAAPEPTPEPAKAPEPAPEPAKAEETGEPQPKRSGWWQRRSFF